MFSLLVETQDTSEKNFFAVRKRVTMTVDLEAGTIFGVNSLDERGTACWGTHAPSCPLPVPFSLVYRRELGLAFLQILVVRST